ncbi:MAG: signal peptidase II [Christensenellales bacterium]
MLVFELILLLLLAALDLISKRIVVGYLNGDPEKVIIKDILTFKYAENHGASFGIFRDRPIIILVISIAATVALLAYLIINRKSHGFLRISLIFILGGAIGNIYDRIAFGYVRDFIDYTFLETWFNINFAICNVADIFLTVGTVMLIIYVLFIYKEKPKVKKVKPRRKKKNEVSSQVETEEYKDKLLDLSDEDKSFMCYDDSGSKLNYDHSGKIVKKKEYTSRAEDDSN